jgi:hypothetical protein
MQIFTLHNFNSVIASLPPQYRPADHGQRKAFRDQIEVLLDTYFLKLPPTLASSGFDVLSERANRRRLKGGRPRHASMDTLVLALADIYARTTANDIEALPVSESSRFIRFMDSCLGPFYRDADLVSALGRRWRDLRKAIRPLHQHQRIGMRWDAR